MSQVVDAPLTSIRLLCFPIKQAGELSALTDFTRQFDEARFRKGLEIVFAASGGKLTTRVDGQEVCAAAGCLLMQAAVILPDTPRYPAGGLPL